ncbi:MAG: MBL fold metallo-hydrolase, partial [Marinobacter sp.]|nr:MBL fold metallo-hydrolase [Marinobacter sp.]
KRWLITAGETRATPLETVVIQDGVIHQEAGFVVRATQLDHGVPVMAYAYEPRYRPKVRGDQMDVLEKAPGEKVVYATDFRDSSDNIRKLSELARDAHTLFCEASFLLADKDQAERTQHLTTEACARIANLADVRQLVAFHFSHRYEKQRDRVYKELQKYTDRLVVPRKSTPPPG